MNYTYSPSAFKQSSCIKCLNTIFDILVTKITYSTYMIWNILSLVSLILEYSSQLITGFLYFAQLLIFWAKYRNPVISQCSQLITGFLYFAQLLIFWAKYRNRLLASICHASLLCTSCLSSYIYVAYDSYCCLVSYFRCCCQLFFAFIPNKLQGKYWSSSLPFLFQVRIIWKRNAYSGSYLCYSRHFYSSVLIALFFFEYLKIITAIIIIVLRINFP